VLRRTNVAADLALKEAVAEAANSTASLDEGGLKGSMTEDATEEK